MKAPLVGLVHSDIDHQGKNLSSDIANSVTSLAIPGHLLPAPVPVEPK
ncbi:hypothetical protein ABZZ17_24110 [Streptomyces sp. NPDC006512]